MQHMILFLSQIHEITLKREFLSCYRPTPLLIFHSNPYLANGLRVLSPVPTPPSRRCSAESFGARAKWLFYLAIRASERAFWRCRSAKQSRAALILGLL